MGGVGVYPAALSSCKDGIVNVVSSTTDSQAVYPPNRQADELFCSALPTRPLPEKGKILVTGASGYVGGRLVPELLARGYQVKAMVRAASPEYSKRWPTAEIVVADALDPASLAPALQDVHAAYYLIHSLLLGPGQFSSADLEAAANFRTAAQQAGIGRIIYLGGLGDTRSALSEHLHSRMKVAQELSAGAVPTTVLRAAIIIGSGSASYEIIQHLVKKLLIVPIPAWGRNRCQPVGIRDVIKYLVGVLETPATAGRNFDIGGADVLSYRQMLEVVAKLLGKKRAFLLLPSTSIRLYAYIASLITPVPAPITRCLMAGLANEVVCQDQSIRELIPFGPLTYSQAIVNAMSREEQDRVHTRWSNAYPPAHELAVKLRELEGPPRYTARYSRRTDKNAGRVFSSICRIGGKGGWFHNNWMWRLRGLIDRLLLGVGSARGRRSYAELEINDVVDFWRVEDLVPDRKLLLRAEMRLPGKAWLEFTVGNNGTPERGVDKPVGKNIGKGDENAGAGNVLSVTAYYQTRTPFGHLYWYLFLPFHHLIFANLIKQIEKRS
jgi:uncharacterized protein YbjT (DUF2867 family)